jgi:hypothetical protein
MCRNIKTLFNFEPPATDAEMRAAALQFIRKISGTAKPSKRNVAAFERAVDQTSQVVRELLESMATHAPPKDRETVARQAKERSRARFAAAPARR